jgi:cysteine sulfinate desulfinase/cysteine desulfurase-like protein
MTDKNKQKIQKKSLKKSRKKSIDKSKPITKSKIVEIPSECKKNNNLIILDNINISSMCSNIEKIYKKNIGNLNPTTHNKIIKDSKDSLLKTCNGGSEYTLFFTSGESNSNVVFLCSAVNAYKKIRKIKPHVLISSVEHESIIKYANSLKDSDQIELTYIKPNIYGCILSEYITAAIKPNTCCVSISYINHELGSVNNIEKISEILHEKKIPLHTDCSYLFGKHKLDLQKTNVDAATITFDKINGPACIGAIIIKNDLLHGYKLSEHSLTLENKQPMNIPAIIASVEAVKQSLNNRNNKNQKLLKYRKDIIDKLSKRYQLITYSDYINLDTPPLETSKSKNKLIILGPPPSNESYYTPSILAFILINSKNKTNIQIKKELEKKCIMVSTPDDTYVYDEIKIPKDIQQFIIRISISDMISQDQINKFISTIQKII